MGRRGPFRGRRSSTARVARYGSATAERRDRVRLARAALSRRAGAHVDPEQGRLLDGPTTNYIVDRHYRVIATVNAGNGLAADTHEFRLTPEGTALIVVYHTVPCDLSAVGGPAAGSGDRRRRAGDRHRERRGLFEWHSLDHVGLDESHAPVPARPTTDVDYFHINAVSVDEDGNLIVDARNTWAFYKVHRHSGRIIWRLGGTKSDFALGPDAGVRLAAQPRGGDDRETVRLFDNEAAPVVLAALARDLAAPRSTRPHRDADPVVRAPRRSVGRLAGRRAGAGERQHLRRLGADGAVLGVRSVEQPALRRERAAGLRHLPRLPPCLARAARAPADGDRRAAMRTAPRRVHAIWNGATEVARWDVVTPAGDGDRDDRRRVASASGTGSTPAFRSANSSSPWSSSRENRAGRELGRSAVTSVTP